MTREIKCSELGIEGCDFTASGEAAGDAVVEMVEHLRAEHDLDMPDAEDILAGDAGKDPFTLPSPAAQLATERLRESLNIVPLEGPDLPTPAVGDLPSR
jgi:predicted small metal-binding protein